MRKQTNARSEEAPSDPRFPTSDSLMMFRCKISTRPTAAQGVRNFLAIHRPDLNMPEGMELHISPVDPLPEDCLDWVGHLRIDSAKKAERPAPYVYDEYANKIGSTGWNYLDHKSLWVGFDFDSIIGHARPGVSDEDLERVRQAAQALPYVEVRRSTGGAGLHLYVFFGDGIPTENHTIHSALGRIVLSCMSRDTGFDFGGKVDVCGSNMWIYSRTANERSFTLLKSAEQTLNEDDLPENWRNLHINRTTGALTIDVDEARSNIELDAKHKALIERLCKLPYSTIWCPERNVLQTHTLALKACLHVGDFETISTGRGAPTPNCFAVPLADGVFRVFRFSAGQKEHESWNVSSGRFSYTLYNVPVGYPEAVGRFPLLRTSKGFQASFEQVAEIARLSGCQYVTPNVTPREITVALRKDGILLRMPRADGDGETVAGWGRHKTTRDDSWEVIIECIKPIAPVIVAVRAEPAQPAESVFHLDQLRHTFLNGAYWGWYRLIREGWRTIQRADAKATIMALHDVPSSEADRLLAQYLAKSLDIVTLNFGAEYPSDHEWNLYGARFRYAAADEEGDTKHFDMVLAHLGQYLAPYVQADEWCESRGIRSGAQYLLVWIAIMVQQPDRHLPWLFLVGPQDHGKSALADMLFVIFQVVLETWTRSSPASRTLTKNLPARSSPSCRKRV